MRVLLIFAIPVFMACAADRPAAKVPNMKPLEVPAGAKEIRPYTYRYTDAAGKSWIYRKTPFGVARYDDQPEVAGTAVSTRSYANVKATDAGESVRFENATPWGVSRWARKKTELNEMERAVWERDRTAAQSRD